MAHWCLFETNCKHNDDWILNVIFYEESKCLASFNVRLFQRNPRKIQDCKYLLRKIYLTKSTYFKYTIQNFQSVLVGPTMQKNNVEQVTIKHRHHFMMSKKTEIFFSKQLKKAQIKQHLVKI